jgi:monothiol glutaredoxin
MAMTMSDSLQKEISDLLSTHPVVLFMKGSRQAPQCGFSAQVVQILDELLPSYATVDVLSNPELREGVKQYSDWPTIPQLYVNGTFIGGCDIVRELNSSGELQSLLGTEPGAGHSPSITVSEAAITALGVASAGSDSEFIHLQVSPDFDHDLYLGPALPEEIGVKTNGPALYMDRASARRADGVSIDFVDGPTGQGFKITNPNEPRRVKSLSPQELKNMLDRQQVVLFDVRPPEERSLSSIPAARPLDESGQAYLQSLDRDAPIALHCHHGVRSHSAAQQLIQNGFRNVYNLSGGIDAWSQTVDSNVPRY